MLIVVADDERTSLALLTSILRKWGHQVEAADNGDKAWELVRRCSPDVVILDWMMPGTSGVDLCRQMRADPSRATTYVILLTARDKRDDVIAGLGAGADDYLTKPLDPGELSARLAVAGRMLESNSDSERVLASISSVLIGLDPNGCITRWNAVAQETFGIVSANVIGRPLTECGVHWRHADRVALIVEDPTLRLHHEDLAFVDPAGRDRFLSVTVTTVRTRLDGAAERVVLGMDVTARRQLESQLRQAQKLEGIGQLAAGIAHEINTPMQYIGDNLRYLSDSAATLDSLLGSVLELRERQVAGTLSDSDRVAAIARLIEQVDTADLAFLRTDLPLAIAQSLEGVGHVSRIVRAMKEFSHPGSDEKQPVDLNHSLETTLVVARNELKYVADIHVDLDPNLPHIFGLAGELNQVLLNLLVNAAHAVGDALKDTPGGRGSITVTTRTVGSVVEVRITDTGTGIPEAVQGRIFEPFFTTKDVGKGTGQGLAMAHATIVSRHRGQLWFETAVGRGTTFVIRLPVTNAEAA